MEEVMRRIADALEKSNSIAQENITFNRAQQKKLDEGYNNAMYKLNLDAVQKSIENLEASTKYFREHAEFTGRMNADNREMQERLESRRKSSEGSNQVSAP